MYCVKCGVKLSDTEPKCPLCGTIVCHPDFGKAPEAPLYPAGKKPRSTSGRKALSGAMLLLYMIPLIITLFSDLQMDGRLNWFGYVAGALAVTYIVFALPVWFQRPNPVIFVPCDFAAAALYLLYINLATDGSWFLSFALPVTAGIGLITCAVIALVRYVKRGRLYIYGGAIMALGVLTLLVEYWMVITFQIPMVGWSVYPLVVLALLGGFLIYLAANSSAREVIARKLFF